MGQLMRAIIAFLVEEGWPFYHTDSPRHLVIPLPETESCSKFIVEAREDLGQALVFAMARTPVPDGKRHSVDFYIGRVNARCAIGSFDFDVHEGLLAYRTGIEVGAAALTTDLIRPLFAHGLFAMEKYIPGILAIMNESATPGQALEKADSFAPGFPD